VHDQPNLAGGAGDRCGAGVGLQRPGIGEPVAVIAELGEHPGTGDRSQAGKAGNDLGVGMLEEGYLGGLEQLGRGPNGGVQLQQRGAGLLAEGVLDPGAVMQGLGAEDAMQPLGPDLDVALPTGLLEQRAQPRLGQPSRRGRLEFRHDKCPCRTININVRVAQ